MRLSGKHSVGKPCPTCHRPITKEIQEAALEERKAHTRANVAKRKLNPADNQGRPVSRNDGEIKKLFANGLSINEIADMVGYSPRTVRRSINNESRQKVRSI